MALDDVSAQEPCDGLVSPCGTARACGLFSRIRREAPTCHTGFLRS